MAISKNLKVFQYQDIEVQFNAKSFDDLSKEYKQKKKVTLGSIEAEIAREVNVSEEAVRNWRFGKNGPGELEMIQGIAKVLELKNWTILLEKYDGGKTMAAITDREKDALKRVYDSIIDFLYEFIDSDGFEIVMYDAEHQIRSEFTEAMYDDIANKVRNIHRTLNKEYFDLGKHEVYNELNEYITTYIYDMFDGKFTFKDGKTVVVKSEISVDEEYEGALAALNRIIEKYV